MQHVFLTGHRGYLGRCLAYLIEQDANLALITTNERLETLEKDSIHCDRVVHTISRRSNASGDNQDELQRDNEESTRALLSALQSSTPIIYTSSVSVYSDLPTPSDERCLPAPSTPYALSKLNAERLLTESDHPAHLLRVASLWGFGHDRYGRTFLDDCLQKVRAQQPVTLFEEPALRQHLFVWDAARWIHTMIRNRIDVPLLNMAGESIVLQEKVQSLCAHAPKAYTPVMNWESGGVGKSQPVMDTRLWQSLCKAYDFALTPWSILEQQAWQERPSP